MSFHGIFSEKGKMTPFNQPSHQFLSKKIQTYTWLAEQMILLCKQPDDKLTSCWDQKGVFQGFWKKFLESKLWVVFLQLISLFCPVSHIIFYWKIHDLIGYRLSVYPFQKIFRESTVPIPKYGCQRFSRID